MMEHRCELWAPWSEESGRWNVLQMSLGFVNLFQIPQLIAITLARPSNGSAQWVGDLIIFSRFMGGLSSAGGSVTLGVVADLVSLLLFISYLKAQSLINNSGVCASNKLLLPPWYLHPSEVLSSDP